MKTEIKTYLAPAIGEYEFALENGIAQSGGNPISGSGISEYSESDMSGDNSFWQ